MEQEIRIAEKVTCENCLYSVATSKSFGKHKEYECRRYPPTMLLSSMSPPQKGPLGSLIPGTVNYQVSYTKVLGNLTCGEHKRKES